MANQQTTKRAVGRDDNVRVVETMWRDGRVWVTLGYTRVGPEYNHEEELFLSEDEARQLLDDLRGALGQR